MEIYAFYFKVALKAMYPKVSITEENSVQITCVYAVLKIF